MRRGQKDYYSVLGVSRRASESEIKGAYRDLAKRYHPDTGGPENVKRFLEVREAYQVLSDPTRRSAHDPTLAESMPVSIGSEAAAWSGPVSTTVPFQEICGYQTSSAGAYLEDVEIRLTAEEAARGGNLELEVAVETLCTVCEGAGQGFFGWCWDCRGGGLARRYRLARFRIPPGIEHGSWLFAVSGPIRARIHISMQ